MKSFELKISLIQKKKRIMRTLLVSKKTTYEQLHEMIQLLFNLDCTEAYTFEVNKKMIQKDKKQSEKKSLIKLKDKDVFYYHYDLVEPLHFKINVGLSDNSDTPKCIQTVGKNLYEGLSGSVEDKYQSSVDINWINECLSYYNEDKKKEFYYEIKNRVKELSQIRYFQDYMHNQIVQIHLPQNRIVYMACDATEDVILNFHINSNKLLEYTSINQKSVSQSIVKYHDCIELCMMKKTFIDQKTDFDFSVGNYGIFLSYANVFHHEEIPAFFMHMYLKAFDQYIKTMQYCQKNQMKFTEGKMLDINENEISLNNGQMVIYNISFLNQESAEKIKNEYPKNQLKVEIDVLTLPKGVNNLETICIVGDSVNGHLECEIQNASVKTMLAHIFSLLQERWKIVGMDAVLVLRDKNLEREFNYLAQQLGIECRLENKLSSIDAKYISTSKHSSIENMDQKTLVLRLLEELGIDPNNIQTIDATNEILEKLENMKDDKKYN